METTRPSDLFSRLAQARDHLALLARGKRQQYDGEADETQNRDNAAPKPVVPVRGTRRVVEAAVSPDLAAVNDAARESGRH